MITNIREYTTISGKDLVNYIDYYYSLYINLSENMVSRLFVDGSVITTKCDDISKIDHIHLSNARISNFVKVFSNDSIILHGTLEITNLKNHSINIICDGNLDPEGKGYIRTIECKSINEK